MEESLIILGIDFFVEFIFPLSLSNFSEVENEK